MPRLSALRLAALADLAEQLRFVPRKAVVRQLERAVELAGDIEPERNYPEDWVIERITGYRPDLDGPATLVGAALVGDLSAFVERVSDAARLTASDLPRGTLGVEALAERWRVSRRTVERYRRHGLVAHRARDERNVTTLVFTPLAIERFEAARGPALARAASFDRMDDDAAQRVVRLGRRAARRFGWSLHEASQRVGARTGRSPATVRRALERAERERAPVFGAPPGRLDAREREILLRADRRGVPVRRLAERFGRSEASVRRLALEVRAERIRDLGLPTGDAPTSALEAPAARSGLRIAIDLTTDDLVRNAASDGPVDAALERALGAAHRALVVRAGAIGAAMGRAAPPAALVDRAETDLRWAALLRVRLVQQQRRTIVQAMENALGTALASLSPERQRRAHRLAFGAAIEAAAEFDPARGGRLAAATVFAVQRAMARAAPAAAGASRASVRGVRLDDWRRRIAPWQAWLDPPAGSLVRAAALPDRERRLVEARFGLTGEPPRTVAEAAEALGVSAQGAARLERAAVRGLFQGPAAGAPGGAEG
jgi:transposase